MTAYSRASIEMTAFCMQTPTTSSSTVFTYIYVCMYAYVCVYVYVNTGERNGSSTWVFKRVSSIDIYTYTHKIVFYIYAYTWARGMIFQIRVEFYEAFVYNSGAKVALNLQLSCTRYLFLSRDKHLHIQCILTHSYTLAGWRIITYIYTKTNAFVHIRYMVLCCLFGIVLHTNNAVLWSRF